MRKLSIMLLFTAMAACLPVAAAESHHKAVQIMADIGPGGAPMRDPTYNARVASLLTEAVSAVGLKDGDTLALRTFGNPSVIDHLKIADWNRDITFSYRGNKVEDLPVYLKSRMDQLSKIEPQAQSDLMFGLTELLPQISCESHDVTTILLTNGIESGTVTGNEFTLNNIPQGGGFCGDLIIIGLWVIDPKPVPGLRSEAEKLFVDLAGELGFNGHVVIKR